MKKKVEQSKYKEGFKREVWMAAEKNNLQRMRRNRECRNQPIEFYVVWLCVWSICGSVQHSSTDHYRPHKAQRHQVTRERAGVCVSFFSTVHPRLHYPTALLGWVHLGSHCSPPIRLSSTADVGHISFRRWSPHKTEETQKGNFLVGKLAVRKYRITTVHSAATAARLQACMAASQHLLACYFCF